MVKSYRKRSCCQFREARNQLEPKIFAGLALGESTRGRYITGLLDGGDVGKRALDLDRPGYVLAETENRSIVSRIRGSGLKIDNFPQLLTINDYASSFPGDDLLTVKFIKMLGYLLAGSADDSGKIFMTDI